MANIVSFSSRKVINSSFSIFDCKQFSVISVLGAGCIYVFLSVLLKHLRIVISLNLRRKTVLVALLSKAYVLRTIRVWYIECVAS